MKWKIMQSVMEVYFKKEGDHLLRGFGPVDVSGDSAYFKNQNEVDYKNDQTYKKVDCSILPPKYQ